MGWMRNWEVCEVLGFSDDGGFESREGKIEVFDFWNREGVFFRITF